MVKDLIKNTMKNLKFEKIRSIQDIYSKKNYLVCFSDKFKNIEEEIKYFLRLKMYNNKNVLIKNNNGKKIIKKLFTIIKKNPRKFFNTTSDTGDFSQLIEETVWEEIQKKQ